MLTELTKGQVKSKVDFIDRYISSTNAADGSTVDSNANVSCKNIATLEAELNKDINIQVNRALVSSKIEELFGKELSAEYNRQITDHEIYVHDESSIKPYCASISMYPFLTNGIKDLGGESTAPKHLESFCGIFINLVFSISSQIAGALATVEFLMYFDYFARKDYGDNYMETHWNEVANQFQHVVYTINQPAAARGYQSVFWNISVYDKYYFESMFEGFVFPDMTAPSWESLSKLQIKFLDWFNSEREKAILTFPVVTAAVLTADGEPKDTEFAEALSAQLHAGNSFFVYMSDSADSLASCCRLRNEIQDNTFSYTLGAGGVSTGSLNVITLNMNRMIQDGRDLVVELDKVHKYQVAHRKIMEHYKDSGLLPFYDAGFLSMDKQYLTIGINGLVEGAEYLGHTISHNTEYLDFSKEILSTIMQSNKAAKEKYGYMFNTEFVPAENLGVKNAKWDKKDGYKVPRDCYNSYFYKVEDEDINVLDKFLLHGENAPYLDGGSALHLNLEEYLSKENFYNLFKIAAKAGCNYWCTNVKVTICNTCDYINKHTKQFCTKCGSRDVTWATRIIGYLKKISAFSKDRKIETDKRFYH